MRTPKFWVLVEEIPSPMEVSRKKSKKRHVIRISFVFVGTVLYVPYLCVLQSRSRRHFHTPPSDA